MSAHYCLIGPHPHGFKFRGPVKLYSFVPSSTRTILHSKIRILHVPVGLSSALGHRWRQQCPSSGSSSIGLRADNITVLERIQRSSRNHAPGVFPARRTVNRRTCLSNTSASCSKRSPSVSFWLLNSVGF